MEDRRVGTTLLGRLRVVRVLGRGGMGVVYEVEHMLTGHRRALKVLRPAKAADPRAVSRFLREASVAGRVRSSRLVEVYDVGQLEDGAPYMLMERLEGRTLAERLKEETRLSPEEAVRIGLEVAEGLWAAHCVGLIHRDLSPKNIFLVSEGELEHVRLVDFGFSKMVSGMTDRFGHLTAEGVIVGTPYYVSPEQAAEGPVDPRADQYSLAVVLYECLAGARPYGGESLMELLTAIASGAHTPLDEVCPDVSPAITRAVTKALSLNPKDRYPDMHAFAEALGLELGFTAPLDPRGFARTEPVPTSEAPTTGEPVAAPPPRRGRARPGRARARGARASPQRRLSTAGMIAGLISIGAFALILTFSATAYVLRLRRRPPPVASARSTDDENLRRLRALYDRHAFSRCATEALHMPATQPVLELAWACARAGGLPRETGAACRRLQSAYPLSASAARCRPRGAEAPPGDPR